MSATNLSFEQLLMKQSSTLINSDPKCFQATWSEASFDVLDWFGIDRLTLYPNSMVLVEDGKTFSVSKKHIPPVNKQNLIGGNYLDYLKLLKTNETYLAFSKDELKNTQNYVLKQLYKEGGRWHCIIPLQLFNQRWGALSFTNFHDTDTNFDLEDIKRLKLVCEVWLCYWQHSTLARTLKQTENRLEDDSDKLLLLTKKQTKVLALIAQGLSAKECAEQLHLSPRTIESHKYRMLGLLDLNNHNDLLQFALRNGLGIAESMHTTR
ncbi:response regulator transcription factor [Vibrio lentus]|uniref:response regulator transcription factor n=1 Tax=Vibrio lentus TaxID=136468 RepID=UPI000C84A0E0|nr:LuxR C-terminal-related transcriptional regulator [Vibrio lentus]PMG98186.1 helix-turn-helix transcriptional regulator [Vibrio lentus]PMH63786.1 helix-turn-helix transcriptional regulator [Vibrio lentus]